MRKVTGIIVCWCCMVLGVRAQPHIVAAEYYLDTDPGLGNATAIAITPDTSLANINFNANIANVSPGMHHLFLRSRDANGKWSITARQLFIKLDEADVANISYVEYFIDTDPGFGNAIAVPVTPGADIASVNINTSIASLDIGLHNFFLRSKNASGKWSETARQMFVKLPLKPLAIADTEYYFDVDPGFGKGVPLALNASNTIADFAAPVNITGLSVGNHKLYIRSKEGGGDWSITNWFEFTIDASGPIPFINVNSITDYNICGGNSFRMAFHKTGTYNPGNVFTVQLSDSLGSFASPITIGSVADTTSRIVTCGIPKTIPNGNQYRIRVVSSNPVVTGIQNDIPITLRTAPDLGPDTTLYVVCAAETLSLNTAYNFTGLTRQWTTLTPTTAGIGVYGVIVTNSNGCTDTAFVTVKQDVAQWTGAISSDWHVAGNWSTNRVPNEKTHVIIQSGTPNICQVSSADAKAASIQVKNLAVVNVINNRDTKVAASCNPLPAGL
ncbi:MAG: hypothetical protein V4722_01825 [Bacteroidota bacterium]